MNNISVSRLGQMMKKCCSFQHPMADKGILFFSGLTGRLIVFTDERTRILNARDHEHLKAMERETQFIQKPTALIIFQTNCFSIGKEYS